MYKNNKKGGFSEKFGLDFCISSNREVLTAAAFVAVQTAPRGLKRSFVMKTKQNVLMAVMAAAFVLGNVTQAAAQTARAEIIVVNRTGAEITEFIISPSVEHYPQNSSCFADGFEASDGSVFAVVLPGDMAGYDAFDIEVLSGGKRYVTQGGVIINFQRGDTPTLELYATGKNFIGWLVSSIPDVATAGIGFATLKSWVAKKAASTAGATAVSKLVPFAIPIPKIALILAIGVVVVEGVKSVVNYVNEPDVLQAQVSYH